MANFNQSFWLYASFGFLFGVICASMIRSIPQNLRLGWLQESADHIIDEENLASIQDIGQRGRQVTKETASLLETCINDRLKTPKKWIGYGLASRRMTFAFATLCAVLIGLVGQHFQNQAIAAPMGVFTAVAILLAVIDLETKLLPDMLTLPLVWLGLLASAFHYTIPLDSAVLGAAFGYMLPWATFWTCLLISGQGGMGFGDFKLLAAIGAWLGYKAIIPVVLIAAVVAGGVLLIDRLSPASSKDKTIPFGPYLVVGALLQMFDFFPGGIPNV